MKTLYKSLTIGMVAMLMASSSVQARDFEYDNDPYLSDLTLINCGDGSKRAKWTEEDFEPYVVHKYADGHEEWFFDAFLLVDTQRGSKKFGNDVQGYPSSQRDWTWMMDQFFDPDLKLRALDNLIEKKKAILGEPPLQHRVVLSLCLPTLASDGKWPRVAWGRINHLNVNFLTLEDRFRCVQWYVDQLIERFEAEEYKNLALAGVYWVEEGLITNAALAPKVTEYVRSKGLRSYWIPYYLNNSPSWSKAHTTFKFDLTYLQPNYAFYTSDGGLLPISVLKDCCTTAKQYKLGLEFEFETILTSNAMHEANPELHQRINDYMDIFEEYGVVDGGAIAYYTGSQGLIDMAKSSDPVNQATMDRLASIVAKRQAAKAEVNGVANVFEDHTQLAYSGEGCIFIGSNHSDVKCYDITGRLVHSGAGRFNCPSGIYILKSDSGKSLKLRVK